MDNLELDTQQNYLELDTQQNNYYRSSFERVTISNKKIHYSIQWIILAVASFTSSTILLLKYENKFYFVSLLIFAFTVLLWPIFYIYLSKSFYNLWNRSIQPLFDLDENWYIKTAKASFNIFSKRSLLIIIILMGLGVLTIYGILKPPFKSDFINTVGLAGFMISMFIASCSINIIISIFGPLVEFSKICTSKDYYTNGFVYFKDIKDYYNQRIWMLILMSISVFFGFIYSPYFDNGQLPLVLVLWIIFISCWPTAALIMIRIYLTRIENNLKMVKVFEYDSNILIDKIKFNGKDLNLENINEIKGALEFKKYLISYKIGETKVHSFFSFLLPIITSVAQLVFAYIKNS